MKNEKKRASKDELEVKLVRELQNEVDSLFKLPLAEFTGARNALAARLKKSSRGDKSGESDLVKALVKPSISAWAVNQLYWNHRDVFDQLLASGERFHKAQSSRHAGKVADMRQALDARREALAHLADLATSLLRDEGHNPAPDTTRRITTTLEAMSVYASRSSAPRPGRLTRDVDPPGFESLASFIPGAGITQPAKESTRVTPSPTSTATTSRKTAAVEDDRQLKDTRKEKIAAAKVALQNAKRSLTEARARAQNLEAAKKKADADVKLAGKNRRDAEKILEKVKGAAEDAARRARGVAVESEEAAKNLKDAERTVEKAVKDLEAVFGESSRLS